MNATSTSSNICKSVFRNGEPPTMSQFTKKWIEMVNYIENNKQFSLTDE